MMCDKKNNSGILFSYNPEDTHSWKDEKILKNNDDKNAEYYLVETGILRPINDFYISNNWKIVNKDSKIIVSHDNINWYKRYFKEYKNNKILTWTAGCSSWTGINDCYEEWEFGKVLNES